MSTHTPGPWSVVPHSDADELLNVVADYKVLPNGNEQAHWIAECDSGLDFGDDAEEVLGQNEANARLIAAAPDLLMALKQMDARFRKSLAAAQHFPDGDDERALDAAQLAIRKAEGQP